MYGWVAGACLILSVVLPPGLRAQGSDDVEILEWDRLPDLPDQLGVAAPFAGVSEGVLIVAGGANFPVPLWKDGKRNPAAKKVWHDTVYVLFSLESAWRKSDPLPRRLAYGASVSHENYGLICIGGADESFHYREVFTITWVNGFIVHSTLAELPDPCAYTSAAVVGDTLYVAGGRRSPSAKAVMRNFWALDLARKEAQWEELPPWPGPARMLAVAGAQSGSFYLISGVDLVQDAAGEVKRKYLTDAYRYTPGGGSSGEREKPSGAWTRLADTPVSVAAAPSPALPLSASHLLVLGGDDGRLAERTDEFADRHPGFSFDTLAYHTLENVWTKVGELPAGHVTASVVPWDGKFIVPSGEVSPGIRSPAVLVATPGELDVGFDALDYAAAALCLLILVGVGVYCVRRGGAT